MKSKIKITLLIILLVTVAGGFWWHGGLYLPDESTRVLSESGYTQIKITGWRPLMAGRDDTFSTGFRAISPSGALVTGAVTSGLFKGNTIRLD